MGHSKKINKTHCYINTMVYAFMHSLCIIKYIRESIRIRTVPEYGHSRYLRNHKSYKKMFNE